MRKTILAMIGFLSLIAVSWQLSTELQAQNNLADAIVAGAVGINQNPPGQRLHIGDGNALIEGGGETAVMFKRDSTPGQFPGAPGGSGVESTNPIFHLGRITTAGDGDPELRVLYSDDAAGERPVLEFDRKGIVASVRQNRGSHFEGFACIRGEATMDPEACVGPIPNDTQPVFRLNSAPQMQLELGPGNDIETDVAVRRIDTATMGFFTGNVTMIDVNERMRIDAAGNVGIGTTNPQGRLDVNGTIYQRGAQLHADYVFEPDFEMPTIEEHAAAMWQSRHLNAIPAPRTDADGTEVIDVGAYRRGMLEELELAHIYIEQLRKQNRELEKKISALSRMIEESRGRRGGA